MIHYMTTNGIGNATVGKELYFVERAGIPFVLHSMRRPGEVFFESEWAQKLDRETRVLYPLPPLRTAWRVACAPFLFGLRFFAALGNALFGRRETLRARVAGIAHLLVACSWAYELRKETVSLIHSQWIHSGGTIAMYGAWLLDVPFSFTGHATDLFRDRVALTDKIRRADFIVCISEFHRTFYLEEGADPGKLHVVYCGIDADLFSPVRRERAGGAATVISSGRLVEKKGFEYVLDACRLLVEDGRDVRCLVGGSGPLHESLTARIAEIGMGDRFSITGEPLNQEEIPEFMARGDVYCLPCVWARDNDVDGLPQMLMEAMACGIPVVSTRLVGIPDLVVDGETGLLVEPRDAAALASAVARVLDDRELSERFSRAGRKIVEERFDAEVAVAPLIGLFRERLSGEGDGRPDAKRRV